MTAKILVIDDDADSLKLIEIILKRQRYQTITANSGKQALEIAELENPDLVILDVMIPDMSGLEICKRLRSNDNTRSIPIIIFTAKSRVDDRLKGFEAGADDYLTKPIHPTELASRVEAVLTRKTKAMKAAQIPPAKGATIGILGAKGGVGTSTIAHNLAVIFAQMRKKVIIIDFNLGAGCLGLFTGKEQSDGLTALLRKSAEEINFSILQNFLVPIHDTLPLSGLFTSARPANIQSAYNITTAKNIIQHLRQLADLAIYDLGCRYTAHIAALQAEMDRLLIISDAYPATLIMTKNLIREIKQGREDERIQTIIMNRAQTMLMPSREQIEDILDRKIQAIISAAPDLAFQSMQKQVPMTQLQPDAIPSSQLRKLAEAIAAK